MGKNKGLKLKLVPLEGDSSRMVFAPVDYDEDKLSRLKSLIGKKYFGEEDSEDYDEVDIDLDPSAMDKEQIEVLEALYDEDEAEIPDDFLMVANQELDKVLEEYSDSEEEPQQTINQEDLREAMNEFISEHPAMFQNVEVDLPEFTSDGLVILRKKNCQPEKITFEEDHVLQEILQREEEEEVEDLPEPPQRDFNVDIQSVTSTWSNIDNRPKVIQLVPKHKKEKPKKETPQVEEKEPVQFKREQSESKEDKKQRKLKVKELKKASRERKKALKETATRQKLQHNSAQARGYDIAQGVSVLKLK
mmetsp:Transcript_12329/g.17962  ORF Transcript_12329/g.17962 Transcript_12329/m.17962 type:complete len:304 (-) Transcript_12329:107-1018(-)